MSAEATTRAYEVRIILSIEADRLRHQTFMGQARPEVIDAFKMHKAEILALLTYPQPPREVVTVRGFEGDGSLSHLALSLYRFCGLHQVLEVKVPWIEPTLFLVPGPPFVEPMLVHVTRGRIWTISEVLDLLLGGASLACAVEVAKTKLRIDGLVTAIGDGRVIVSSHATKEDETIATDLAA